MVRRAIAVGDGALLDGWRGLDCEPDGAAVAASLVDLRLGLVAARRDGAFCRHVRCVDRLSCLFENSNLRTSPYSLQDMRSAGRIEPMHLAMSDRRIRSSVKTDCSQIAALLIRLTRLRPVFARSCTKYGRCGGPLRPWEVAVLSKKTPDSFPGGRDMIGRRTTHVLRGS